MHNKFTALNKKIKKYMDKASFTKKTEDLDQYFVKITKIYKNEFHNEIMIEYYVMPYYVSEVIPCSEFINSPLIYAVHPKQLYVLGTEIKNKKLKFDISNDTLEKCLIHSRLKKVLH